jgi:hypothetical protein
MAEDGDFVATQSLMRRIRVALAAVLARWLASTAGLHRHRERLGSGRLSWENSFFSPSLLRSSKVVGSTRRQQEDNIIPPAFYLCLCVYD